MKNFLLCLSLTFFCKSSLAQTLFIESDQLVTVNAYNEEFTNAYSAVKSPGSLANVTRFSISGFSERKYMISDLGSFAISAVFPFTNDFFGCEIRKSGLSNYGQLSASIAYCRKIKSVGLALKCSYYHWSFKGYDAQASFYPELSAAIRVVNNLQLGVSIGNPGFVNMLPGIKSLSSAYRFSLGFASGSNLFAGLEVRTANGNAGVDGLLEYRIQKKLTAIIGISSGTGSYLVGAAVQLGFIEAQTTFVIHPQLGLTPALLVNYQKNKIE